FEFFFFVLLAAVLGRWAARKFKQPAVLGELLIGVALGAILYELNADFVLLYRNNELINEAVNFTSANNVTWSTAIHTIFAPENTPNMDADTRAQLMKIMQGPEFTSQYRVVNSAILFSSFGVILLLFMVGLEISIEEMREVGSNALVVALLGIVLPFGTGFGAAALLIDDIDTNSAIFIGATLAATSIGITARVFRDMKRLQMPEAKIVLGAAVFDDILGLIILAVVSGLVTTGEISFTSIAIIMGKSIGFLVVVMFFGIKLLKSNIKFFARLDYTNLRLLYPFGILVLLAFLADLIGLASIVGAFAAGLILKEEYFIDAKENLKKKGILSEEDDTSHFSVEDIIAPIEGIFAPVFFVLMGVMVDVTTFAQLEVLLVALALTLVAIVGKVLASVFLPKNLDKWTVGVGMVPRGEVGLIFASIGKGLGVLDAGLFSAIIIVVILTTLITPPALKFTIDRAERKRQAEAA
ncbi:MAG: cation:proton antiporter, partial [Bacteroidota bacterium]